MKSQLAIRNLQFAMPNARPAGIGHCELGIANCELAADAPRVAGAHTPIPPHSHTPVGSYFPHARIGYRCNPFRALTDEEWAEVAILPAEVETAAQGCSHVQLLGEMGRGKTTALLALAERFRSHALRVEYEYLAEGVRAFGTQAAGLDVFLLDEAWRLGWRERRRLLGSARAVRLIFSSHVDLASLFARRRLPLVTLSLDALSAEHFHAVLERRLEYFALPGVPRAGLSELATHYLHRQSGGNLRAAQHLLYELFQRLDGPAVLTPGDLERMLSDRPAGAGRPLARSHLHAGV